MGIGGTFARQNESNRDYFLKNVHGDVTAVTNGITITKTYEYDAYGVEKNPDENDTNPFRYCGEYFDSESESIYLRNRYYSTLSSRFITEAPIKDGLNWYVYVCDIIEIKIFLGLLCLCWKYLNDRECYNKR